MSGMRTHNNVTCKGLFRTQQECCACCIINMGFAWWYVLHPAFVSVLLICDCVAILCFGTLPSALLTVHSQSSSIWNVMTEKVPIFNPLTTFCTCMVLGYSESE